MDFDTPDIALIAKHGLEQALEQGSVLFVDHGFCWYCNEEKEVYEASPNWPVQPPRCFDCYVEAIKAIFESPQQLHDLLESVEKSISDD
jgi:hypothetical protein